MIYALDLYLFSPASQELPCSLERLTSDELARLSSELGERLKFALRAVRALEGLGWDCALGYASVTFRPPGPLSHGQIRRQLIKARLEPERFLFLAD